MVIIGGTNGDVLGFSYKTTYATSAETAEVTAGPYITSLTPATLANTGATTTITGGNFATDASVLFIGTDSVERSAKTVVRNSATSLTVTRPDTLPQAYEPYSVKVTNPGINSPVGSNAHILSNAIDAGSSPTWTTAGALTAFKKSVSYTYNLSASDADSSVTYAIASGALPSGLSLNTSTGVISGTPTVNTGTPYSFVIAATDSGGNTTNSSSLTLSQVVPDAPTIGTATSGGTTSASVAFTAPSYTGTSTITSYTATAYLNGVSTGITGTLSQSGSGTITVTGLSGTTSYTFKVKATNSSGDSIESSESNSITTTYRAGLAQYAVNNSVTNAGTGGGTFTLTPYNTTYSTTAKFGSHSLAFAGSGNQYAEISTNVAYNATNVKTYTLAFWMYYRGSNSGGRNYWADFRNNAANGNDNSYWGWDNTGTMFSPSAAGGDMSTSVTLNTNTWEHWAMVANGSSVKIYRNGTVITTANGSTGYGYAGPIVLGTYYGVRGNASGNYFSNFLMDDIYFTNAALTDAEITQLASAASGF